VEFRLLGPLQVLVDERDVTPARPKQRALLTVLMLRANEVVARDELVEALWGEQPPDTAMTALHGHVSALRKLLGAEAVQTRPPGYVLHVGQEQTDVGRFHALRDAARAEPDPARRAELLGSALSLFRGEPLSEFRYEDFARSDAQQLAEMRSAALEERIEAELVLGRHAELVAELERLLAAEPLRERLRGQLMLALYGAGRQADALHVYREGRRRLAEELGLEPGPALKELEGQILAHDPALTPAAAPSAEPASSPRRERKVVSVLFCDLVGFTARSDELDPEDVQAVLEPYFTRVRAELERFGGTVEKFIGDAVMAVFGAPVAHEDDAERAVRAALAVRDALRNELQLQIAVHTGEALVTLDADARAGEGIVAGDVVNTASRLQAFAPPNGVIVGERTRRATAHTIGYRDMEPVVARGKREPLPVWEAVEPLAQPTADRPRAELVGRVRELDQLADALARAVAERSPQLLTVLGVPGIGKTRLVEELAHVARRRPQVVTWLTGRSLPYGDGVTSWALSEIVKQRAGVLEGDPPDRAEAKLRTMVGGLLAAGGDADWVLRHLRPLLGLGPGGEVPRGRQDESFAAWRLFVEALAESPLVLVFEDLHWADDTLLDFIDDLAEQATDVPLLAVCTSRPELLERRPGWGGGKRNSMVVSLSPLSDGETAELLAALLETPRASEQLIARTGGNPLYAEEYARLALERWPDVDLPVPPSLHSLIAARLDTLPAEQKEIVQAAAVVGEIAWAGAIAAVGGRARPAVEELARALERKEFLRRRRRTTIEGETEYTLPHALVRDVAYAQIPRADRSAKHRAAAEWINSLGRRDDHAELLAHHYASALELGPRSAELEHDAVRALRAAGERAAALGAHGAAARYLGAALELLAPDDPERPAVLVRQGGALYYSDLAGEKPLLEAAASGDRAAAATAEALLWRLYQEEGRGELARPRFARALELAEGLPASAQVCEVLAEACRALMLAGEDEQAVRLGDGALQMAGELGLEELRAHVLNSIGPSRQRLGDVEGGVRDLERAIEIASAIGSPELVRGYGNLINVLADAGDLRRASEARAEGVRQAERFGLRQQVRWMRFEELDRLFFAGSWDDLMGRVDSLMAERSYQAMAAFYLRARVRLGRGELEGAVSDAARALDIGRASTDPQVLMPGLAITTLTHLAEGREDATAAAVDELLELVRRFGTPMAPQLLPPLAIVLRALGRSDELPPTPATPWREALVAFTSGDFARAADLYERIGSHPDEAYARLRAGEALVAAGRRADADEQLDRALAFFRRVGASAYIREAEPLSSARSRRMPRTAGP
jgi:DNA-binding SARP family transcriptional activator